MRCSVCTYNPFFLDMPHAPMSVSYTLVLACMGQSTGPLHFLPRALGTRIFPLLFYSDNYVVHLIPLLECHRVE